MKMPMACLKRVKITKYKLCNVFGYLFLTVQYTSLKDHIAIKNVFYVHVTMKKHVNLYIIL